MSSLAATTREQDEALKALATRGAVVASPANALGAVCARVAGVTYIVHLDGAVLDCGANELYSLAELERQEQTSVIELRRYGLATTNLQEVAPVRIRNEERCRGCQRVLTSGTPIFRWVQEVYTTGSPWCPECAVSHPIIGIFARINEKA